MKKLQLLTVLAVCAIAYGHPREAAAQHDHAHHGAAAAQAPSCVSPAACSTDEYLLGVLQSRGVEAAMASLDSLAARDTEIRRDAHGFAHAIGLAAYTTPDEVGDVFARCTPAYQSGCYHGVIQSYFLDHAATHGDHMDAELVNALCAAQREDGADRWLLFQCAHGMGHGLLMLADHHLPTSLEWCDLVEGPWERESCYGGAFMESIVNATAPHHMPGRPGEHAGHHDGHGGQGAQGAMTMERPHFPPLDANDPLYPCSVLEERYLAACYQMQTSAILYQNRQDLGATARVCQTAPEVFRSTCFQSLGRDISSITLQDHQRAMRLCAVARAEYEPWCHIGYTKNLVDVTADANDGFEYCRLLPAGENKRVCYVPVGEEIWVLENSTEARGQMCEAAEPEYLGACRHGAGLPEDDVAGGAVRPGRTDAAG